MKFYKFDSIEAFRQKHAEVKLLLNIPNENTKEYTQGLVISENEVRAAFEDEYAENLIEIDEPTYQQNPWEQFPYEIVH